MESTHNAEGMHDASLCGVFNVDQLIAFLMV